MAQMSAIPSNHEIVEIEEELNPGLQFRSNHFANTEMKREEKDRKSLASNDGNVSSLEEDLNQLFEIFNRRASSHGPSKKNASKRPVKTGGSPSPGHEISERMNLKKALRGLCLSQASEMAAMKRSMKSPRVSEAGKIMTMYRNVVIEDSVVADHSQDDSKMSLLEISFVPEQTTFESFQDVPEKLPSPDLWPSNRNSLGKKAEVRTTMQNDGSFESMDYGNQTSKPEKSEHANDNIPDRTRSTPTLIGVIMTSSSPLSSPTATNRMQHLSKISRANRNLSASVDQQAFLIASPKGGQQISSTSSHSKYTKSSFEPARNFSLENDLVSKVVDTGTHKLKIGMPHQEENVQPSSCLDASGDKAFEHNTSRMNENGKLSSCTVSSIQIPLNESVENLNHDPMRSSRSSCGKGSLDIARKTAKQTERFCTSPVVGNQKKISMAVKEEHAPTLSPRRFHLGDQILGDSKNSSASTKLVSKDVTEISAKEFGRFVQKPKGEKVSRSTKNAQHLAKPLIKTKNFVKQRSKKKVATDNDSKTIHSEFNNDLYSTPISIVCPRCQCDVTNAWKEANTESSSHRDSPISPQESLVSPQESPSFYQDSPISPFGSLSGEINSGNTISDFDTPEQSSDGLPKTKEIIVDSSSNSKSRNKAEFTQSSKSSPDECSSSASVSEKGHLGRPSFCDRPHMSKDVRWEAIRRVRFEYGTLGLRNFSLVKKLGCGDIGTVYLAELIGTNCLFAIKVMDNEFLVRRKKISRAQTEKEILRMLDHPFLPTLYCQFTSDNLSCLVMEYCPGGDLHVLRQRQPGRCFTEQAARFYVAEVLLALEYLHMLGVVYRDLKPENILVREDGHIMLSDFDLSLRCAVSPTLLVSSSTSNGTKKTPRDSPPCRPLCIEPSCQVTCFTPRLLAASSNSRKMKPDLASEMRPLLQLVAEPTTARSNSFVGTHEYLSPEIIKGEGHGSAVDWWTFGIFLYELLYGRTPFKGPGNEETLANVVLQNLKFPDSPLVSLQARDLIAALLVKEPENRLGTERGAAEIKQHPFFNGLNWALIRCAVPPELPESRNYGMSKSVSGSGSREHLEFEVF